MTVSYVPLNWNHITSEELKRNHPLASVSPRPRLSTALSVRRESRTRRLGSQHCRLRRREPLELQRFVACGAVVAECAFDNGLLTLEEKRTLDQLSDEFIPKQKQLQSPPTSQANNDTRLHTNTLTSRHTTYAKHVEVGVDDPVVPPEVEERDEGPGFEVEGGVPGSSESSDATLPEPWDVNFLSGTCPEDRAVKEPATGRQNRARGREDIAEDQWR